MPRSLCEPIREPSREPSREQSREPSREPIREPADPTKRGSRSEGPPSPGAVAAMIVATSDIVVDCCRVCRGAEPLCRGMKGARSPFPTGGPPARSTSKEAVQSHPSRRASVVGLQGACPCRPKAAKGAFPPPNPRSPPPADPTKRGISIRRPAFPRGRRNRDRGRLSAAVLRTTWVLAGDPSWMRRSRETACRRPHRFVAAILRNRGWCGVGVGDAGDGGRLPAAIQGNVATW